MEFEAASQVEVLGALLAGWPVTDDRSGGPITVAVPSSQAARFVTAAVDAWRGLVQSQQTTPVMALCARDEGYRVALERNLSAELVRNALDHGWVPVTTPRAEWRVAAGWPVDYPPQVTVKVWRDLPQVEDVTKVASSSRVWLVCGVVGYFVRGDAFADLLA